MDIRAPIDVVFAALTDPRRGPEWNPNILDVSGLSRGPLGPGSSWQQTMVMLGRPTSLTCRIVQWNPPHEGLLEVSGPHNARIRTICRPLDGGTRVTQILDFVPPGGALGRLAANLMGSRLQQEVAQTLERQRAVLEKEAGTSGGSRPS